MASKSIDAVQLFVPVKEIDEDYITTLQSLVEDHRGSQPIRMTVFDHGDKELQIGLRSANGGVRIDNEFLEELENNNYQFSVLTSLGK